MTQISKEYGTALFMLACEKEQKHEYAAALETVKKVFEEEEAYLAFLSSPAIAMSERLDAISAAFGDKLPEDVVSYMQLLCEKGRMACFYDSVTEYNKLLFESERVSNAKITSAVALTEDEKQKLKEKLEEKYKTAVTMEFFIDETLLGGIVAEIDGKVLDGSLRSRLRDIKDVMNT
ncbi:MAG: ATP synthase F1 subunit delta [Clostridia bacterium]|nr:ATP synthase F1 subunit delta [Clostridia bacterium]